jgi:ribonuclease Z
MAIISGASPDSYAPRATSMGDNTKALDLYYPAEDVPLQHMRNYIEASFKHLPFSLSWNPLTEETLLPLPRSKRAIRAFDTRHVPHSRSMGFSLVEHRTRLRAEYRELSQSDLLLEIKAQGKEAVMETYEKNLLSYTGDAMPVDPEKILQTEVLLHDATFLKEEDRDMPTHATVDEVLITAKAAKVQSLVLYHISSRYFKNEVENYIRQAMQHHDISFEVYYFFPRFPQYHFLPITLK